VKRLPISLLALVAGLALAASGCGSVSSYAARVDGKTISQANLETELRDIAANDAYIKLIESRQTVRGTGQGTFDAAFTALALTRQIYYQLIGTELVKRRITVGPPDLAAARTTVINQLQGEDIFKAFPKSYQDELISRQARLDLLTLALNDQAGSADQAARAYYDQHKDEFAKACVSHILLADQAKADAVKARLAKGEDFAAVAKTDSTDSQSAPKGGELGCDITRDTGYPAEFIQAVLTQPVGQPGDVVKTTSGFHIIKVTSRTTPPFEEVSAQARQRLTASGQEKLLTWLQGAVGKAKIEVNPKYGSFDKTSASPGVVPPARPDASTPSSTVPVGAGGLTKP
jgi:hypothetical protein